jgi:uncharacterized spore protein YtfJ
MDVENLLAKASENFSVRRAFGAAYEKDGMLIIPVAMVAGGGGGGTSRPRRGNSAARPDGPAEPEVTPQDAGPMDAGPMDARAGDAGAGDAGAMDAGGGFGGLIMPTGAYVVKGDQVRWVPAVDVTIVVLASLSLARVLARVLSRRRGNHGQP